MGSSLVDISDTSNEIILSQNSAILNIILATLFIVFLIIFIYICRDDKKKFTKNHVLRKLLFIKRNT